VRAAIQQFLIVLNGQMMPSTIGAILRFAFRCSASLLMLAILFTSACRITSWDVDFGGTEGNTGQRHYELDDDKLIITPKDPKGKIMAPIIVPRTNKEAADGIELYAYNGSSIQPQGDDLGRYGRDGLTARAYCYYKLITVRNKENSCEDLRIVQLKQAKVTKTVPPAAPQVLVDDPGWVLDLPEGVDPDKQGPAYPPPPGVNLSSHKAALLDEPGYINPWIDTATDTELDNSSHFLTFVLCCNPLPRRIVGYFSWGFVQHVKITGPASATHTITPEKCLWHPNTTSPTADYNTAEAALNKILAAYPKFCPAK
jgi:hypothetical protein